jgi:putative glutamine amidotransferase
MITVGIPETRYSNKRHWKNMMNHLFDHKVETINIYPWVNNPGGDYRKELMPKNVDFIIFDGGADVHPILYKESSHQSTSTNLMRDWTELLIFQHYLNLPTKFIGICRGIQFLNVAFGGTLHQDLHSIRKGHQPVHLNTILPNTKFSRIIRKKTMKVNSLHHQAVDKLGRNLRPIMVDTSYKVIEVIESKKGDKVRAVQSHPEYDEINYKNRLDVMNWLLRMDVN